MADESSNNLRKIRKERGFKSARALAEKLDKPISTIISHENEQRTINDEYVKLYCEFFNVSRKSLLGEDITELNTNVLIKIIKGFCLAQDGQTKKRNGCINEEVINFVITNIDSLPVLDAKNVYAMINIITAKKTI